MHAPFQADDRGVLPSPKSADARIRALMPVGDRPSLEIAREFGRANPRGGCADSRRRGRSVLGHQPDRSQLQSAGCGCYSDG